MTATWSSVKDHCLLDAPADMEHKYPIDARYSTAFPSSDLTTVFQFLRETLAIPRVTWTDYIEELRFLKDKGCQDVARIESQYSRLKQAGRTTNHAEALR